MNVRIACLLVTVLCAAGCDDNTTTTATTPTTTITEPTFADTLTAANKACSGKVVPTIKLAKVLLSDLPDGRRPSGYHLENLAVEVGHAVWKAAPTRPILVVILLTFRV